VIITESLALSGFPVDLATEFVSQRLYADEMSLMDEFRDLIRAIWKPGEQGT
jgi:hypothetical protein